MIYEDLEALERLSHTQEQPGVEERAGYKIIDWKKYSLKGCLTYPYGFFLAASRTAQMYLSAAKAHAIVILYKTACIPSYLFDQERKSAAHYAAMHGRICVLRAFNRVDKKSLKASDSLERHPMHLAAIKGEFEAMEFFLKKNISSVDAVDGAGNTLLHLIAQNSSLDENKRFDALRKLICEYDASKNWTNKEGVTPVSVAISDRDKGLFEVDFFSRNGIRRLEQVATIANNRKINYSNLKSQEEDEEEEEEEEVTSLEDTGDLFRVNSLDSTDLREEEEKNKRFLKIIEWKKQHFEKPSEARRREEPIGEPLDLTDRVRELNDELGEDGFIDLTKPELQREIFVEDMVEVMEAGLPKESADVPAVKPTVLSRITDLFKNPFKKVKKNNL